MTLQTLPRQEPVGERPRGAAALEDAVLVHPGGERAPLHGVLPAERLARRRLEHWQRDLDRLALEPRVEIRVVLEEALERRVRVGPEVLEPARERAHEAVDLRC